MDFACPKCSEIVKANDDQAGQPILCPKCEAQIKVPGNVSSAKRENDDQWSIFDEEEKFFEEQVDSAPDVAYRTKADELEPIVDNDEEEAAKEKLEQQQAAAEAIAKTRTSSTAYDSPVSSSLTIDEKIEEEEKFKKLLSELPDDSPLKRKAWDRSSADEDALGALHLDGDSAGKIRAKCFICDSVSIVKAEKSGQTIVCSDCGSDVKVPTAEEVENAKPKSDLEWQKWVQKEPVEKQRQRKIDDELFSDVPSEASVQTGGYDLAPVDDDEYGLAPADESLLTPIAPMTFDEEVESQGDLIRGPADASEADFSAKQGGANLSSADAMPPAVPRPPRPVKDPAETITSSLFEEMQAEKEANFERLPWAKHIFGVMLDLGFVARCLMVALMFAVTVSIYLFAEYIQESTTVVLLGLLLKFPAFVVSLVSLLCVFWLGQTVINTTILGQKQFEDIGGFSVFEFLSNSVFVALSFALCSIPGVTLGYTLAMFVESFDWIWLIPSLGSLSALILTPFPLLSALEKRAPYMLFSPKILNSFKEKAEFWFEFYPTAGILAVVVCGTWFLGVTQNWLISMLMCLILGLSFGIYFRMLGRLAGSVLNEDPKPKKKKETA